MPIYLLVIATVLSTLLTATGAPQEPVLPVLVPAPPGLEITSFDVAGTGCPSGSSYYALSPDDTTVIVTISEFHLQVPSVTTSDNRKNCRLTFGVNAPPGFAFGITNIGYRGYYQLDKDVTAQQTALYYFYPANIVPGSAQRNLTGPLDGADYIYRDQFQYASMNQSPCGIPTVLNVQNGFQISNSKNAAGGGSIGQKTDSIDGRFQLTLNFEWYTCHR